MEFFYLVCLAMTVSVSTGLECYVCSGLAFGYTEQKCVDGDIRTLPTTTCPSSSGSYMSAAKCAVTKQQISKSGELITSVARGCSGDSDGNPDENGCTTQYMPVNGKTLEKTTCYCSTTMCNGKRNPGGWTLANIIITCSVSLLVMNAIL